MGVIFEEANETRSHSDLSNSPFFIIEFSGFRFFDVIFSLFSTRYDNVIREIFPYSMNIAFYL